MVFSLKTSTAGLFNDVDNDNNNNLNALVKKWQKGFFEKSMPGQSTLQYLLEYSAENV